MEQELEIAKEEQKKTEQKENEPKEQPEKSLRPREQKRKEQQTKHHHEKEKKIVQHLAKEQRKAEQREKEREQERQYTLILRFIGRRMRGMHESSDGLPYHALHAATGFHLCRLRGLAGSDGVEGLLAGRLGGQSGRSVGPNEACGCLEVQVIRFVIGLIRGIGHIFGWGFLLFLEVPLLLQLLLQ